jgi:hypothetical protein
MPPVNFKGIDRADNNRDVGGADVLVDGKYAGRIPFRAQVSIGPHTVEFKPTEHYAIQQPVQMLNITEGWTDGECIGEYHQKLKVHPMGTVLTGKPISISGTASPGAKVSVYDDWGGSELSATAGPQGHWGRTWVAPDTPGQHTIKVECLEETVAVTITARKP